MSEHTGLFSSSYWAFHRNTLLFSAALLLVSLPGVSLDPDQTVVVFQFGHLASRVLKWTIALAAIYSFAAYFLEWRQEAYGFYLVEHGLLQDRQHQVAAVVEAIQSQIAAVDEYHQAVLRSLDELNILVKERIDQVNLALDEEIKLVISKNEFDSLISEFLKDINARFKSGVSSIQQIEMSRASIGGLLESEQVAPRIRQTAREFARNLMLVRLQERLMPDFSEFKTRVNNVVKQFNIGTKTAAKVARPLADYEKSLSSLRAKLVREKRLTTTRVWVFGIVVPSAAFSCAIAHFVGSEFFQIFPSITSAL